MELAMTTNKNDVVSIFVSCIDFTIRSRTFDYRIEQLHRAGINAQVIAGRSKEMGLILTELVTEINAMASKVGGILQKSRKAVTFLAAWRKITCDWPD